MRLFLSRIDRLFVASPDPARVGWLRRWEYAHRGLHGPGRVENGPSAFRAAVAAGMGVECDVQRSADACPMIFHDWDFTRLIGRPEKTGQLTAAEWHRLSYLESEDAPITLAELLAIVGGQVPILIEIKSRPRYDVAAVCERVRATLTEYDGPFAVMSFDPRVSRWFRRHAPEVIQGLVMREDERGFTQKRWQRHLALWIARPEFIAYHIAALPNAMVGRLRERGLPVLTWTVSTPALRAQAMVDADALIAEGAGLA